MANNETKQSTINDMLAALRCIAGWLNQPVQTSGELTPSTPKILRADAAFARHTALAAIARYEAVQS